MPPPSFWTARKRETRCGVLMVRTRPVAGTGAGSASLGLASRCGDRRTIGGAERVGGGRGPRRSGAPASVGGQALIICFWRPRADPGAGLAGSSAGPCAGRLPRRSRRTPEPKHFTAKLALRPAQGPEQSRGAKTANRARICRSDLGPGLEIVRPAQTGRFRNPLESAGLSLRPLPLDYARGPESLDFARDHEPLEGPVEGRALRFNCSARSLAPSGIQGGDPRGTGGCPLGGGVE